MRLFRLAIYAMVLCLALCFLSSCKKDKDVELPVSESEKAVPFDILGNGDKKSSDEVGLGDKKSNRTNTKKNSTKDKSAGDKSKDDKTDKSDKGKKGDKNDDTAKTTPDVDKSHKNSGKIDDRKQTPPPTAKPKK